MSNKTREALVGRPDVDDHDIDDIIGIAQDLQDADRASDDRATVAEVEAVAAELDIDPKYIEQAITSLGEIRDAASDAEAKALLQRAERSRMWISVGVVLGAISVVLIGAQFVIAKDTGVILDGYAREMENTAAYVDVVLDRQAALVPQLVAISGGDAGPLEALVVDLRAAETLEVKLDASRAMDDALGSVLAGLPPAANDTESVQRLGLTHEITGIQNRRGAEVERFRSAETNWKNAQNRNGAWLARTLGWVIPPEV